MDFHDEPLVALERFFSRLDEDRKDKVRIAGADRNEKSPSSVGAEQDIIHCAIDAEILLAEKIVHLKVAVHGKGGEIGELAGRTEAQKTGTKCNDENGNADEEKFFSVGR